MYCQTPRDTQKKRQEIITVLFYLGNNSKSQQTMEISLENSMTMDEGKVKDDVCVSAVGCVRG
jgi:hypothetical protein